MPKRLVLPVCALLLLTAAHAGGGPTFHWERIRVLHALPSQVFARLGLTHITKRGYTRDGAKKTDPDPTFPPGVLDVVPMDEDKLLLARGTDNGLTQLRQRVLAADIAAQRWHLTVTLTRPGGEDILAAQDVASAATDAPTVIALSVNGEMLNYQLRVHVNPDGELSVACQSGVPLPPAPAEMPGPNAPAVFTPTLAWATPDSKSVKPGETVVFEDREADRKAARAKVGRAPNGSSGNFAVRVTIAAVPLPAAPAPPEHAPAL